MAILSTDVSVSLGGQAKAANPPLFTTLPELFLHAARTYDLPVALSYPRGDGRLSASNSAEYRGRPAPPSAIPGDGWLSWSHRELVRSVRHLALGLRDLGVQSGESVGLIAPSSPLWMAVDLAIQFAGGVTVPLFKRISLQSFLHEIRDSGMKHLLVGNPEEMPMAFEHGASLVHLVSFWYSGSHPEFDRLEQRGAELDQKDPQAFDRMAAAVTPSDLATIIYTSGSTGLPKGVELTQENLVSQVKGCFERFPSMPADVALSTLPLEHVFERMVSYFYLASGIPVYFVDDPKRVGEYMARVRPTIMTVVPRILEKVATRFSEAARETAGIKGVIAQAAIRRARRKRPDAPSFNPLDMLYRAAVYRRMTGALGGSLRMLISGSARLQPEVATLLVNIGVPIHEGYGLTEAAPVISANYLGHRRLGTVGQLFPGVEVRIAEDGEILARGPNIMRGYHNDPQATAAAITPEGWLRTGDLGELDPDGYLVLHGRKKELFKKSTGEYVPPTPIEYALSQIPFVDTAVIVADNRTWVTALLFPDPQKLAAYKERVGLGNMADAEFLASDFLRRETQEEVARINAGLHHCERVERFTIMDHPAGVETGELTPTLKPRRFYIEDRYRDLIDAMYLSVGGWK